MLILLIDNYDSFTHNLVHLLACSGAEVHVRRNDDVDALLRGEFRPDALAISPGPGSPLDAGSSAAAIRVCAGVIPIFGVCLGMQVINEVFGGSTRHAPRPVHGKRDAVSHEGTGIFRGIPSPFTAARYHSLCIGELAAELRCTAHASDGVCMAVEHRTMPIHAVQFHPESFMTEFGADLAANFLHAARTHVR